MKIHEMQSPFCPAGSGVPRTHPPDAVHLTDVVRYIAGVLNISFGGKGTDAWDLDVAAEAGFIWEDVLSAAFRDRYAVRLPEQRKDNIIFSPDGFGEDLGIWDDVRERWVVEPNPEIPVLEEYKCTWMSVRKHPLDIWRWTVQTKGYLYGLDLNVVVYRILHLMGDYQGSGPLYRVVRIEYDTADDKEDLRANWEMLTTHAEQMLSKEQS